MNRKNGDADMNGDLRAGEVVGGAGGVEARAEVVEQESGGAIGEGRRA